MMKRAVDESLQIGMLPTDPPLWGHIANVMLSKESNHNT